MPPSLALVRVPTRVRSNQTTVLLRRMPGRLRAVRAMLGSILFGHAISHQQICAKGFQQAQVDIEADRDDTGLDIGDGRLCCARRCRELLLGNPSGAPAAA